jgi:SprT protein
MQNEMAKRILEKVEESFLIAEAFFNTTFERPRNIIFKRSGTTAGYSNYNMRELMFQLDLAEAHAEEFIRETVPHEVAHYVQRAVYGYSKRVQHHGWQWKYIMSRVFKLVPERCHTYDTSVTKVKRQQRFPYKCACRTHSISTTIHNRIQQSGRKYRCTDCGTPITFDKASWLSEKMKSLNTLIKEQEEIIKAHSA